MQDIGTQKGKIPPVGVEVLGLEIAPMLTMFSGSFRDREAWPGDVCLVSISRLFFFFSAIEAV